MYRSLGPLVLSDFVIDKAGQKQKAISHDEISKYIIEYQNHSTIPLDIDITVSTQNGLVNGQKSTSQIVENVMPRAAEKLEFSLSELHPGRATITSNVRYRLSGAPGWGIWPSNVSATVLIT
jgi:hypothetical protein